jgi:hypothetical protein
MDPGTPRSVRAGLARSTSAGVKGDARVSDMATASEQAATEPARRRRINRRHVVPFAVWALLVTLFASWILASERDSERDLERRYALRAAIAGRFVESYVADTMRHEGEQAYEFLRGPAGEREFERAVTAFGYQAAVLLDSDGRVLRIYPPAPDLIGQDLTPRYAHLATAVTGRAAVSGAILSAARRRPIVAFAVPFASPAGGACSAPATSSATPRWPPSCATPRRSRGATRTCSTPPAR